jgi:hypothetical protein
MFIIFDIFCQKFIEIKLMKSTIALGTEPYMIPVSPTPLSHHAVPILKLFSALASHFLIRTVRFLKERSIRTTSTWQRQMLLVTIHFKKQFHLHAKHCGDN